MAVHDIKVHPQFFNAIADGSKPFEVRKDDRGYAVGDVLRLREWDPDVYERNRFIVWALSANDEPRDDIERRYASAVASAYTGRVIERSVTYRLALADWPAADTVMGLSRDDDEVRALKDERARIAAALGASAESDLVSLATTLATFYAAHAETMERQRDALREIAAWATEAYPVGQFPDQDRQRAADVLADAGISFDALHGQWARHLTAGIGEIARKALEEDA